MRHAYKKYKFDGGQDATQMALVKLATNLLKSGKLVLTDNRARAVRSYMERLIVKAKSGSQADKNVLLNKLHNPSLVKYMLDIVAPAMKRDTGFFRMEKLFARVGDGAKLTAISFFDEVAKYSNTKPKKVDVADEKKISKKPKNKK